ncbi:MAG: hypothetical protein JRI44_05295 [Deltaproteobacteria bacterium]|nr:hypothetical protein [Deltaproteobacteria bacterium]
MITTRKEFLKQLMKLTNIDSIQKADELAQAVISLIKLVIGPELSEKIANSVPEDLKKGWESIAFPTSSIDLSDLAFEMEEGMEESSKPEKEPTITHG